MVLSDCFRANKNAFIPAVAAMVWRVVLFLNLVSDRFQEM